MSDKMLTVNDAVALRISELLAKQNITAYRLIQRSGLSTSRLSCIMRSKNKTVTLSTVLLLAQGFNMTLLEFFDSPYFDMNKLEVE